MMKLVVASNNKNKIREIRALLSDMDVEVFSPSDLGIEMDVEETGATFEENSLIKALAFSKTSGLAAVADDSGLVVDALGGEPGVYSARYGGDEVADDTERYFYLLKKMEDKSDRRARFVSCITCVMDSGEPIVAYGEIEGEILREPRGNGGFGYDPVFYMPQLGMTMAEISAELKNSVSHRAIACEKFKEELRERLRKKC